MPESGRAWDEVRRFLKLVTQRKNPNSLRVALVERNIIWENKSENLTEIKKIMKLIEGKNVDLVALPEMSLTGFSMNTEVTSESADGTDAICETPEDNSKTQEINTVREIKKLAMEYGVSIGAGWVKNPVPAVNETEKNDGENSDILCENHYSIISQNGKLLLDYIKIHPFSFAGEDKYFKGGEKLSTCSIEGFEMGVAICYDLRFPEFFIKLSEKAELIIVPANWPAARSLHWKTLLRARAIENQCYVAGVNCSGDMDGQTYSGDSAIYSPEGEMLTPVETITINETDKVYIYDIVNDVQEIRDGFPVRNDRKKGWM
jgi:predicted amidohydrolase